MFLSLAQTEFLTRGLIRLLFTQMDPEIFFCLFFLGGGGGLNGKAQKR